jgi:regulator of sirC expression with transglutaminase-like and TPR domain
VDNLKQIHWRNKNWESAELCLQQQILLMPERHEFRIQYGAVQEMKGNRIGAQQSYLAILQETRNPKIKETVAQRLLSLEKKPQILH